MAPIPVTDIPTLTSLYDQHELSASEVPVSGATSKYNDKISLIRTDITKLQTDAIVNAANESLLGGGGVDGAIHNAAGPDLIRECRTLRGCDTGDAKITNAYRLPSKKVIHAVGPVYGPAKRQGIHAQLLGGCYTRSLDLAVENGCKSIAFSALSTGVYGYPSGEAAETAISAVKGWLNEDEQRSAKMERVVFCSFLEKDERAYEKFIPKFFPPASAEKAEEKEDQAPESKENKTPSAKAEDSGELPKLPEVPTKDPIEDMQPDVQPDGQPEAKKARVEEAKEEKL